MKTGPAIVAVAVGTVMSVTDAIGQTVHTPVVVATGAAASHGVPELKNSEVALAASYTYPGELIVVWQHDVYDVNGSRPGVVYFATSTDNGASFPNGPRALGVPSNSCDVNQGHTGDPMVAVSHQTGDLFAGALVTDNEESDHSFVIGRKPANTNPTTLSNLALATLCDEGGDKGFLAVGPWPAHLAPGTNVPETMYVAFTTGQLRSNRAADTSPVGSDWGSPITHTRSVTTTSGGSTSGTGAFPLVLPSGRLLLGYTNALHVNPASVRYSETGTDDNIGSEPRWHAAVAITDGIDEFSNSVSIKKVGSDPDHTPIPGGASGVQVISDPAVAYDPNSPSNVFIIFTGRANSESSTNLDLFIGWSQNGGETFPAQHVFQISDDLLRPVFSEEIESDEWKPSIAIDAHGGINILFTRTADADSTTLANVRTRIRYARWSSIDSLQAFDLPFLADLSDPFPPWIGQGNEYHMLASPDCNNVYAAWISSQSGTWDLYVSRITLGGCDVADVDGNGLVNNGDAVAFTSAFAAQEQAANVNYDAVVDIADFTLFMADYACGGCHPH